MQRHVSSQQQSLDWSDNDWFDLVTIDLTFLFSDHGNYSRDSKNGVFYHKLGSASGQTDLRSGHLQLRLKQQLLRSKDGNGNCSCRDSDVDFLKRPDKPPAKT